MKHIFKNNAILLIFIWLAGIFIYSFMIQPDFRTLDDVSGIVENPTIRNFSNLDTIFTTSYFGGNSYYRPLVYVSYMFEYHFFGLQAQYYYVVNIILHLLSATVVFLIGQKLFKHTLYSFLLSLFFAVHPIHWEAVCNIPGRSILLCALFYFLSFYNYLLARQMHQKKYCVFSLIFFALSLLSKESGITLPITIFAYAWIVRKEFWRQIPTMMSYFLVAFVYMIARHVLGITSVFKWRSLTEAVLGVITFLKSVIIHWSLLLFPRELYFDRSQEVFKTFLNPEVILVVFCFVMIAFVFYFFRKKMHRLALFGAAWFFIDLLPVSQIVANIGTQPGHISTADHFLYTPFVGFFIFIILITSYILSRQTIVSRQLAGFFIGAYVVFLGCIAVQQNIYSSHEIAMLKNTFKYNPNNARMRESYGFALVREGKVQEAISEFRKVLELNPSSARARIALGKALCDAGRCVEGALEYDKIIDPGDLRDLLEENKKLTYDIVIKQYKDKIKENPDNADLHYSLGVFYSKSGQVDQAIDSYKQALKLNPQHQNAQFNLESSLKFTGQK